MDTISCNSVITQVLKKYEVGMAQEGLDIIHNTIAWSCYIDADFFLLQLADGVPMKVTRLHI